MPIPSIHAETSSSTWYGLLDLIFEVSVTITLSALNSLSSTVSSGPNSCGNGMYGIKWVD